MTFIGRKSLALKMEQELRTEQKNKWAGVRNNKTSGLENDDTYVRIAVAHNKEDAAETVIYNMVRGSSLLGLAGIKPVRGRIVRPLLMTNRCDIEAYLAGLGQEFITDSTNLTLDYARNKIRLSVIPELMQINERAVEHIVEIAKDAEDLSNDINREIRNNYRLTGSNIEKSEAFDETVWDNVLSEIVIDRLLSLGNMAQGELILSKLEEAAGRRKDITREHISLVKNLAGLETGKRVDLHIILWLSEVI